MFVKIHSPATRPSVSLILVLSTHRQGDCANKLATYLPGTQVCGTNTGQADTDPLGSTRQLTNNSYNHGLPAGINTR